MQRRIQLVDGPRDGEAGILHHEPGGGWPTSLLLHVGDGRGARYVKRSNSRFAFAGYEPIPADQVTVEVVETPAGWVFRDPRGINDYAGVPTIPRGTPDIQARLAELFAGGRTHFKFIPMQEAA